jgi:hypothetical protein
MMGYHLYYPNRQPSPAFALLVEALRYRAPISQKSPLFSENILGCVGAAEVGTSQLE